MLKDFFRDPLKRRFVLLGAAGSLAIVIMAALVLWRIDTYFLRVKGEYLTTLAQILAAEIDADEHAAILSPEDMPKEAYAKITAAVEQIQNLSEKIISAYTVRIKDGEVFFIVSPPVDYDLNGKIEGELEERDDVGLPYEQPPDDAMTAAIERGEAAANASFTADRWGSWLTGCAPLRTRAGIIDGAVCIDEDARQVRADMRKANAIAVGMAAAAVLLLITTLVGYLRAKLALVAQQQAEADRERLLRRFEAAIENTPAVAVQAFARDGTILLWNNASRKFYGYAPEEALGKSIFTLLFKESEEKAFRHEVERICETKRPAPPRTWPAQKNAGGTIQVYSSTFPIVEDGEVVEIFCMDIDVTREFTAKAELEKNLERMKSFSDMMIGRETRMIELKREINELCVKLGIEKRYAI